LSLISQGLKKAHLETLRQDRENRREYFSPAHSDLPSRHSSRGLLLGAALLGAVLAAAATAAWVSRPREGTQTSISVPSPANASGDNTSATIASRPLGARAADEGTAVEQQESGGVVAEQGLATRQAAPPARSIPPSTIPAQRNPPAAEKTAEVEQSPVVVKAPVAKRESPVPARPKRREGLVDGESYSSPVRTPGGGEVRLSGISTSMGQSLAIINGSVVREGEQVGPLVVEKIERGRVRLRYGDVRFWLSY
jgi:hypothetical protein